jgi:hypothetical protein
MAGGKDSGDGEKRLDRSTRSLATRQAAIDAMRRLARRNLLAGLRVQDLRAEGRRWSHPPDA